jgi:hypothetical protein
MLSSRLKRDWLYVALIVQLVVFVLALAFAPRLLVPMVPGTRTDSLGGIGGGGGEMQ